MSLSTRIYNTFPLAHIPNIWRFYLLTTLNNLWFLSGNWIFYWLRYMTYGELGLMDALCFLFGLVMEVPSGAIADMIGKRKTIIAGMALASAGFLTMGSANSLPPLWIGFLLAQAGWAFYSGAAEALAYDSLVDAKQENSFDRVISVNSGIATITTVVATLVGGLMYVLHFRSTHLGMGVGYLIAIWVAIGLTEPKTDTDKFELSKWWKTLVDGSKQLLLPNLKPYVIVILALMGTEYMYEWGLLKPAIASSFGFLDKAQAILFATFGLLSAMLMRLLPKIRALVSDKVGLYMLTVLMGIGFLMTSLPLNKFGIIPMLIIGMAGYLVYPWISVVVNNEIDPKHRATALSTVALITKLPYVMLAILAGAMIEKGELAYFSAGVGMFIIVAMFINIAIQTKGRDWASYPRRVKR